MNTSLVNDLLPDGIDPIDDTDLLNSLELPPESAFDTFVLPERIRERSLEDLDNLITRSESDHAVYPTGFAALDEWTDGGISPGKLILLGALPNYGKTAVLQTLLRGMVDLNSDVIAMAFSLDDTVSDYLARYLAGEGRLPIWACQQATNRRGADRRLGTNYEERFERSCTRYRNYTSKRLMIKGKRDITLQGKNVEGPLEIIERNIQEVYNAVRTSSGRRPQLVITIDSPRNIKIKEGGLASNPTAMTEFIGSGIKEMLDSQVVIDGKTERIEPIIFTTEHIKKLPKDQVRPGADDIKDSITLQYHADLLLMLWNDACYRARVLKQDKVSEMTFDRPDLPDKRNNGRPSLDPIVELTLGKNKDGRMHYGGSTSTDLFKFYQDQSRVEEITDRAEFDLYAAMME